jgi:hypothetical protein
MNRIPGIEAIRRAIKPIMVSDDIVILEELGDGVYIGSVN